jgi:hypothetical protein
MKTRVLAAMGAFFASGASLLAQCNSFQAALQLAPPGGGFLIEHQVQNGETFWFFMDGDNEFAAVYVGEEGSPYITGWNDAQDGWGTITAGDVTCKVLCLGDGSLLVSVEMPGLVTEHFVVNPQTSPIRLGHGAFSSVYEQAIGTSTGDQVLTLDGMVTESDLTASGTTQSGNVSYSITAVFATEAEFDPNNANNGVSFWIGTLTGPAGSVACTGYSFLDNGSAVAVPFSVFTDLQDGVDMNSFYMSAIPCDNCQLPAPCFPWDSTASDELGDFYRNQHACIKSWGVNHVGGLVGFGALAIIGCGTAWIPINFLGQAACVSGYSGMLLTLKDQVTDYLNQRIERDRVLECICAHALSRSNGGSPGNSCDYNCPN